MAKPTRYTLTRRWVTEGTIVDIPPSTRIVRTDADDVTKRLLLWLLIPTAAADADH